MLREADEVIMLLQDFFLNLIALEHVPVLGFECAGREGNDRDEVEAADISLEDGRLLEHEVLVEVEVEARCSLVVLIKLANLKFVHAVFDATVQCQRIKHGEKELHGEQAVAEVVLLAVTV